MTDADKQQLERVEAKLDALARWTGGPVAAEFVKIGLAPTSSRQVKDRMRKLAEESGR